MATSKKKTPQGDETTKAAPTPKSAAKVKKVEEKVVPQKPAKAPVPAKAAKAPEKASKAPEKPAKAPEKAPKAAEKPGKAPKAAESPKAPAHKGKATPTMEDNPAASAALKAIVEAKASTSPRAQGKNVRKTTVAVFTLDDVREVLKNRREEAREEAQKREAAARRAVTPVTETAPTQARVLGAATLADILGFASRPVVKVEEVAAPARQVPDKFRHYHDLLVAMREKIQNKVNQRSRIANPADSEASLAVPAQTDDDDTFDHDFALSLVANEQDALQEIDAALDRIYDGSYGICEITGHEISPERLEAVPFARYSVEGQAQFEMQNRRKAQRTTTFLDSADETGTLSAEEPDE
jgi:RNA polymerase-binding transcription factor DksA